MSHIKFTEYYSEVPWNHPEIDPNWLEASSAGQLSQEAVDCVLAIDSAGIADLDGDGYMDVQRAALEKSVEVGCIQSQSFPLATYFDDSLTEAFGSDRLAILPLGLLKATRGHDFKAARDYFSKVAQGADNPLKAVADPLARHLAATALHAGVYIASDGIEGGFSVAGDGRLRFNCKSYAQLAHSDLQGIDGLSFEFITISEPPPDTDPSALIGYYIDNDILTKIEYLSPLMGPVGDALNRYVFRRKVLEKLNRYSYPAPEMPNSDDAGSHMLLLVSDKGNNHLLIDNHTVIYLGDVVQALGCAL